MGTPVRRILRDAVGVRLLTERAEGCYDAVVSAVHANQALAQLDPPSVQKRAA